MRVVLIGGEDNKRTEMCSGDSAAETYLESRASGHLINSVQRAVETIFLNTFHETIISWNVQDRDFKKAKSSPPPLPPLLLNFFKFQGCYFRSSGILGDICTAGPLNVRQSLDKDCSFHLKSRATVDTRLVNLRAQRWLGIFKALHHGKMILGVGRQKERLM